MHQHWITLCASGDEQFWQNGDTVSSVYDNEPIGAIVEFIMRSCNLTYFP